MPRHMLRELVRRQGLLCAGAALLIAISCSHDSTRPAREPSLRLSRAIVSSPVPTPNGLISHGARESADSGAPFRSVAYVSMQPGVVPSGVSVSIQRQGAAAPATTVPMVDGGFDPVAILADVDDTLQIVTRKANGATDPGIGLVIRRRPPSIVRTIPAAQRTDVPLNTGVLIVFTEPMDSASVVNGITLQLSGVVIPSTVSFTSNRGGAIQVTVQPVAPLDAGKIYELVISTSVRNMLGESMSAPVVIPFTTASATTGSGDLIVNSFKIVEYQYDDGQISGFDYSPQLLVTAPAGLSTVHIRGFLFERMTNFPLFGNDHYCAKDLDVAPGHTVELFKALYGEYPIDLAWTEQAAAGAVSARIRYKRDGESAKEIALQGDIVPGTLPAYSGGPGYWGWCRAIP